LNLAFLIALRAISICLVVFTMFGTAEFHKSLKALKKLKFPDKLIQMIMFTYRYILIFMEEMEKMFTAAKARLFKRRTDVLTLRTISSLTGMLFIRGFDRTDRVYNAMVSRGYTGTLKVVDEFNLRVKDFVKAFFIIGVAVVLRIVK